MLLLLSGWLTCTRLCNMLSLSDSAALRLRIFALTPSNTLSATAAGLYSSSTGMTPRKHAGQNGNSCHQLEIAQNRGWACDHKTLYGGLPDRHVLDQSEGLTHLLFVAGLPELPAAAEGPDSSCPSTGPAAQALAEPLTSCRNTGPSHISTGCCCCCMCEADGCWGLKLLPNCAVCGCATVALPA